MPRPEAVVDPLGIIVDMVDVREPRLDRAAIVEVVTSVSGGRAKRRSVALALTDKPELLTEGRSPAPRGVGDLLIALRRAGATSISPPVCAECDKPLRTLQRRGQDWYCGVCGPRRETCAGCGKARPVHSRDRGRDRPLHRLSTHRRPRRARGRCRRGCRSRPPH